MADGVHLGPFELAERVGSGGMGVVYRAEHAETGQPVAVKVLLAEVAREPDKQRAFRREVQALAKLHHPAIASVLDYGAIDAGAADRGPEAFVAGAPWFAMEYVDGRPMPKTAGSWKWERLKSMLLTTLDALAHAHARSIIHRDLKPGNVLIEASAESGEPEAKLVDFGLARIFDPESNEPAESSERVSGTPKYMAPEQILGRWRDQGAWTDLYALGCLVWRVVCEGAPFDGETTSEVLEAHVQRSPPAFEPNVPVPPGFEGWLRGLLYTELDRRTRRAADAAWQLLQLGAPESSEQKSAAGGEERTTTRAVGPQPTLQTMEDTIVEPTPLGEAVGNSAGDPNAERASAPSGPSRPQCPPVLPDWRRGGGGRTAAVLPIAGLELFALREVPVVDRDGERDRMWSALRSVQQEHRPELVTLEAGAGTGKSRLARWLCCRVLETGAGEVLRATHNPSSAPDAGLRGMVRAQFRTQGLARGEVHERLLRRLPPREGEADQQQRLVDARALTELLRPTDDEAESVEGPRYRFSDPNQKYALMRRLFERIARERPLVVWFDDLQWGRQSVGVLEHLYTTSEHPPPMLAVATLRSDLLAEEPERRERLDELCERAGAARIELSRLRTGDHRTLIDRLLHLDRELADAIAERTEGNPLFAVQLLRELVEGNRLKPSSEGFVLHAGESLELPEDVHDLWIRRLRRLVDDLGGDDTVVWRALERAAALGREVDAQEWRATCAEVGLERPDIVEDTLVERGLAERSDEGWAFAHGLLVDSLERRARERGRWEEHHRRCAELLEELYPDRPERTAARRADHWIEAEEPEEALEPLLEDYGRLRERGDRDGARETLERRGELLDQLGISGNDPRPIENDIELASVDVYSGAPPDEVLERLEETRARAKRNGDDRLVARAATVVSLIHLRSGEIPAARETARRATRRARGSGETDALLRALNIWGWTEVITGNLETAEKRFSECRTRAFDNNDRYERLDARRNLAVIWKNRGDDERASQILQETLGEARVAGYRTQEARCHNVLGELARFGGEADEARRHYRRYARIMREAGDPRSVALSQVNLAQVELMAGAFEAAREELEEGERRLEELSQKAGHIHAFRLIELTLAAGTGEWSAFDEQFAHYEEGWPEGARLETDHPWLLEMAGDHAAEAGEGDRAERAWELSRELWDRLDDEEAAEQVADKLEG